VGDPERRLQGERWFEAEAKRYRRSDVKDPRVGVQQPSVSEISLPASRLGEGGKVDGIRLRDLPDENPRADPEAPRCHHARGKMLHDRERPASESDDGHSSDEGGRRDSEQRRVHVEQA
jgi:hypothetical protein